MNFSLLMIKRDTNRISRPLSNPACGLLAATLEEAGVTQATAADGMGVSRGMLNEVLKRKRGVSIDLALRAQAYFGVDASVLVKLQAQYDFENAHHEKYTDYTNSIVPLEVA